jgi:CBS domain-containing protein
MNRRVTTLDASDTVIDALRVMTEKGVGCVVITSDSRPVGILTERDVMKTMMRGNEVLRNKLSGVMSLPLTTVPPDTPVVEALNLMMKKNIRRLPIVSDGVLQGIITIHQDLLYWALAAASGNSSSLEYSNGPLSRP